MQMEVFLDWVVSENILSVNLTLERRHVIQDFVLERLEQLEMRPMRNSSRNSFTLCLKDMCVGAD